MLDIRETPVSIEDADALAAFETALKQFQTYTGAPIATIEAALEAHPDFVLGHVFRSINYSLISERRFIGAAREALEAAAALGERANQRERLLIDAARQLADGCWDDACRTFDAVLTEFPRDVFALQTAHLLDFFRGDALNLRNRPARVLPDWSSELPGYSYIHGMYAFGLEEANEYERAETAGRRALELDPVDAWAVHAVVHVMEMQARADEGIEFLESREADWIPDNTFAYHNWWHLALMYLERYDDDRVLEIFDRHIADEVGDFAMGVVDVTALLWRLQLVGVDVEDRMHRAADLWATKLPGEPGFYAFNDFHAALAFAGGGRLELLDELEQGLSGAAEVTGNSTGPMARDVGMPLLRGIRAYAAGHAAEAVQWLNGVRDIAQRFGGSHAQRDIITLTLLDAAQRNDDRAMVRHIMNERKMAKPNGVLAQRILERTA